MAKKRKQKHLGFHKWNKWGKVWVYEGDHCLAVGSKKRGYAVFQSKAGVKVEKDGKVTYKDADGFTGTYETRREASNLVRTIDEALSKNSRAPLQITLSGSKEDLDAFSMVNEDSGGKIVTFHEDDIEGYTHEKAHYLLGHLDKDSLARTKGKKLRQEKEAVECQIRDLKWNGKYTPKMRKSIIKNLATYFTDKNEKTRLKKAEKVIKEVED